MSYGFGRLLAAVVGVGLLAGSHAWAAEGKTARVQAALQAWLAERSGPEKVTGVATYISFGDPGPAIEAFAGRTGADPDAPPVTQQTLFQIGSASKSFAAAVILKLEAAGRLSLDDTLGRWLPQYPAWKDVTLRRLLNMTSGIPNYSEAESISKTWAEDPHHVFTAEELVRIAYPTGRNDLPASTGYHYSNTNYILAGMIAAKAGGKPFSDLVHEMVIDAVGLDSTFYEEGAYPARITKRLAHGYFDNPACAEYQPDCARSWTLPLMGRDIRDMSTSWAQAAGGAIGDARDVDRWIRAVFAGRVVPPKQQAEWMTMVSTKTGQSLAEVSESDPRGFALGLARAIVGPNGPQWFYEGETLGYRTLYVWFAKENLMITVQTNSQPDGKADELSHLVVALHDIARDDRP